jgi:hypothetical protein
MDEAFRATSDGTLPLSMCMTPANGWIFDAATVALYRLKSAVEAADENRFPYDNYVYTPFALNLSFTREYLSCPRILVEALIGRMRALLETCPDVFQTIGGAAISEEQALCPVPPDMEDFMRALRQHSWGIARA